MRNTSIFVFAALLCINIACSYSESDIYYAEPIAGDPPTITVSSNLDTVSQPVLTDTLEVLYDVEIENGELYQLEAYYLDEIVYVSDSIHGAFYVTPAIDQLPGIDTLKLYFFYSTNSNSLADFVNLEYNFVTLDYPVKYETEVEK